MKKKATYEEISIECVKHALDFLHYIETFHNLRPEQLHEVRKFIHIINGYNNALKNYRGQKDVAED